MSIENFSSITVTVSGGFFGGILLGYALKKVIRIAAVVVGLFIAGLVYLQYQQIASINWDKLNQISEGVVNTFVNTTMNMVDGGHPEIAKISYSKLWYSYDKQYVNRIYNWLYEGVGIRYEQAAKHNK